MLLDDTTFVLDHALQRNDELRVRRDVTDWTFTLGKEASETSARGPACESLGFPKINILLWGWSESWIFLAPFTTRTILASPGLLRQHKVPGPSQLFGPIFCPHPLKMSSPAGWRSCCSRMQRRAILGRRCLSGSQGTQRPPRVSLTAQLWLLALCSHTLEHEQKRYSSSSSFCLKLSCAA